MGTQDRAVQQVYKGGPTSAYDLTIAVADAGIFGGQLKGPKESEVYFKVDPAALDDIEDGAYLVAEKIIIDWQGDTIITLSHPDILDEGRKK